MDKKSKIFNVCITCKKSEMMAFVDFKDEGYFVSCLNINCRLSKKLGYVKMEEQEVLALKNYIDVRVSK